MKIFLLFIFTLSIFANSENKHKIIKVSYNHETLLVSQSYADSISYLKDLYKEAGIKSVFINVPRNRAHHNFKTGDIHAIGAVENMVFKEIYKPMSPYTIKLEINDSVYIICRKDKTVSLENYSDYNNNKNIKIGFLSGHKLADKLFPDKKIMTVTTIDQLKLLIERKRIDCTLTGKKGIPDITKYLERNGIKYSIGPKYPLRPIVHHVITREISPNVVEKLKRIHLQKKNK
jgi:hypothetical protein